MVDSEHYQSPFNVNRIEFEKCYNNFFQDYQNTYPFEFCPLLPIGAPWQVALVYIFFVFSHNFKHLS